MLKYLCLKRKILHIIISMLDNVSGELLKYVNLETQGKYKVLSFEEIQSSLNVKEILDADVIRKKIKLLTEKEYLSVKYEDEGEICLSVLAKGRQYLEKCVEDEIEKTRLLKSYFIYGFLGAFLGSIVGVIVNAVILLIR